MLSMKPGDGCVGGGGGGRRPAVSYMSSMLTHMRHSQESEVTRAATSLHPPHTHTYYSRDVYGDIFARTMPFLLRGGRV